MPAQPRREGRGCVDHPYSDCGPFEFRNAIGTSFAAPQVSAAAALLLGQRPSLRPEQVSWLLERSADDASAATGCSMCPMGRDLYTGWGSLDVLAALTMLTDGTTLPVPDRFEPNDDAGPWAHALPPLPRTIDASLDYWDDNIDVYRVHLNAHAKLFARLTRQGRRSSSRSGRRGRSTSKASTSSTKSRLTQGRKSAARCGCRSAPGGRASTTSRRSSLGPMRDPVEYRLLARS